MAAAAKVAGEWGGTLAGFFRNLLPQIGMVDPAQTVAAVGELVGPAVDLWTGPKSLQEKVLRSAGALADLVAKPAVLAVGYAPEAKAAIRTGGDPGLVGLHQVSIRKLLPWLENGKLPREFYGPSVAINKGEIPQNFGELTFIMRPDALDPVLVPGKIWNRDAYTPRYRHMQGRIADELLQKSPEGSPMAAWDWAKTTPERKQEMAINRLRDRFQLRSGGYTDDPRLTEGVQVPYTQEQAILTSPTMKSFKEFEANPRGAALLGTGKSPLAYARGTEEIAQQLLEQYAKEGNPIALAHVGRDLDSITREYKYDTQPTPKVIKDLLDFVKRNMAYAPSDYAELKVTGPVRADASNWAGASLDQQMASGMDPKYLRSLMQLLDDRGIPLYVNETPEELLRQAESISTTTTSRPKGF